ncbi:MAG: MFS transporter [Thermoproteota archaeon]
MGLLRRMINRLSDYLVLDENLRVLSFVNAVMSFAGSLYGSLLGLYITGTLGVSILVFGFMNTARDLVSSLASFPSGVVSDIFGMKKMMLLAIVFSILTLLLLFLFKDPFWLLIALVFQGLSTSFMGPSSSSYVIDVVPKEKRGKAYATLAFLQSLSSIIATSIAGIIAVLLGFYWLFAVALILESATLCGTMLFLKESLGSALERVEERRRDGLSFMNFKNGLSSLKNPLLFAVLLGIMFHTLGLGIQGPYLAIYAEDVLAFSLPTISLMLSAEQLGILIGHLPSGKIVDKHGGEISFAFHIAATSPCMILFTISKNPFWRAQSYSSGA